LIVNLVDGIVEDYRDPIAGQGRYKAVRRYSRGEILRIDLPDGGEFELATDRVLP
jgi:hypothetical protein